VRLEYNPKGDVDETVLIAGKVLKVYFLFYFASNFYFLFLFLIGSDL
jgi:hypothetical protein